jgi:integrase
MTSCPTLGAWAIRFTSMSNLFDTIRETAGANAPALLKHLAGAGITDWDDLTRAKLYHLHDYLTERVAPGSARAYMAVFKGILARFEDEVNICKDYRDILRQKAEKPQKTYLTKAELKSLEAVPTKSDIERSVLYQFLIGAYTGMRISDIRQVSRDNVRDGYLSYVSQKTRITAVVPCSERVLQYIDWVQANGTEVSLQSFNEAIRRLARRAGIRERVKVYRGGRRGEGEKWRYISSHTARISFCTNLAKLQVPILDISRMAGHTTVEMTNRYIVQTEVNLSKKALEYFD